MGETYIVTTDLLFLVPRTAQACCRCTRGGGGEEREDVIEGLLSEVRVRIGFEPPLDGLPMSADFLLLEELWPWDVEEENTTLCRERQGDTGSGMLEGARGDIGSGLLDGYSGWKVEP